MKFQAECKDFTKIASRVVKAVSRNDQSQTTFTIANDKLTLTTVTPSCYLTGSLQVRNTGPQITEQVVKAVDGSQLKTILSILPKSDSLLPIDFEMQPSANVLKVAFGGNVLKLPIYNSVTTKAVDIQTTQLAEVDSVEFMSCLSSLSKVCSSVPAHQDHALSCLHLNFSGKDLTVMTTNGISLAEYQCPLLADVEEEMILIKPAQAALLIDNDYDKRLPVKLLRTPERIGFVDSAGVLCLVNVANMLPINYRGILSKLSTESTAKVKLNELKACIDSLSKLCPSQDELIFKTNTEGKPIIVSNANSDIISLESELKVGKAETMRISKAPLSQLLFSPAQEVVIAWNSAEEKKIVQVIVLDKEGKPVNELKLAVTVISV